MCGFWSYNVRLRRALLRGRLGCPARPDLDNPFFLIKHCCYSTIVCTLYNVAFVSSVKTTLFFVVLRLEERCSLTEGKAQPTCPLVPLSHHYQATAPPHATLPPQSAQQLRASAIPPGGGVYPFQTHTVQGQVPKMDLTSLFPTVALLSFLPRAKDSASLGDPSPLLPCVLQPRASRHSDRAYSGSTTRGFG